MRKWISGALLLAPAAAMAGPLSDMAGGGDPTMPFDTAIGQLMHLFNGPLFTGLGALAILMAIPLFVMGSGESRTFGKLLLPFGLMAGTMKIMGALFGITEPEETSKVVIDDKPGVFSVAWDWFVTHLAVFGLTFGVIAVIAFTVGRTMSKRAARLQVKIDVRDLLETIDRADTLLLYWQSVANATPDDQGPFGEFLDRFKRTAERKKNHAEATITSIKRVRDELLPMLDQAHSGKPLDEDQRKKLGKVRDELNRYMKDEVGVPIDITAELAAIQQPEKPAEVRREPAATVEAPAAEPRVQQVAAAPVPAVEPRSSTDDFLNPLNPLSPLSPISPWSVWHGSSASASNDDREHHRHDTDTLSRSFSDDNREDDSRNRAYECSSSDSRDDDGSDRWGSSSNSDSCSYDTSSDSSSSDSSND